VDGAAEVAVKAEHNFLVEQVKSAMDRLPPKEQMVLSGMYLEEREPKQLAESLDMSLSHIYRLQKQGIRRVRGMLSRLMQEMKNTW
jgi:RNA polymerase sporulation-specific sigma factor